MATIRLLLFKILLLARRNDVYNATKVTEAESEIFQLINTNVVIMNKETTTPFKRPKELFKAQIMKFICFVIPVITVLEFAFI